MRRSAPVIIAATLLAFACSSGDDAAVTTAAPPTTAAVTTTTVTPTTTAPPTTTSTSVAATTTTVAVSVPPGFVEYQDEDDAFQLTHPDDWVENPDFPAPGVGFLSSNAAFGLPPTDFSVSFEALPEPIDLVAYTAQLIEELQLFSENFELLDEGATELAGAPARFFEFVETQLGSDVARLEVVTIIGERLVSISFTAPVETFEAELDAAEAVIASFQVTTED